MNKIKINLFSCFIEERRNSMNSYVNILENEINKSKENLFFAENNTQIINSKFKQNIKIGYKINLLYNKFITYPNGVKKYYNEINHITDHTYAHLISKLNPISTIITVHDIMPLILYSNKINGITYPHYPFFFKFSISYLKLFQNIITVSNSSKNDLINYLGIQENKIDVIYNGVKEVFKPLSNKENLRIKYGIKKLSFVILIIGTNIYKNIDTSFKVINELIKVTEINIETIIIKGSNNLIIPDSLLNNVTIFENIDDIVLNELYNISNCLLFPSFYEGFGWPPLEAMTCGTPTITSNAGSLREILGNNSILVDPLDIKKMIKYIILLIENEDFKNKVIDFGFIRSSQFKMELTAENYIKFYKKLSNKIK